MEHIISGVAKFQKEVYPSKKAAFQKLANGQNPEVLFITCADSRIDPNLVTQTEPGELFICRNAGNIIPPHSNQTGGMTASIEFAVAALGVSHIIICGHSDCGHSRVATEVVKEKCGCAELNNNDHLGLVIEENVVQQLQHIKTHPAVAAKIATGQVKLHGWVYDIESAEIKTYDEATGSFKPVEDTDVETLAKQSK